MEVINLIESRKEIFFVTADTTVHEAARYLIVWRFQAASPCSLEPSPVAAKGITRLQGGSLTTSTPPKTCVS